MTNKFAMTFFSLAILILLSTQVFAQGGMGKLPRNDVVMLSQVVRDSLSDEMYARILDLKKYALESNLDSAAPMIAVNTSGPSAWAWTREASIANPDDAKRIQDVVDNLKKLFTDMPDMHQQYFAVFKTKDTPSGQVLVYQIDMLKGTKKRMVTFRFFPIGDKLLFGSAG